MQITRTVFMKWAKSMDSNQFPFRQDQAAFGAGFGAFRRSIGKLPV
jgi:hypothetical protein